jgi:hypothetical protein
VEGTDKTLSEEERSKKEVGMEGTKERKRKGRRRKNEGRKSQSPPLDSKIKLQIAFQRDTCQTHQVMMEQTCFKHMQKSHAYKLLNVIRKEEHCGIHSTGLCRMD